jgi:WD40 repeat protein
VLLVVVVSGLVAGLVLVRQHGPAVSNQPTAKPGQTAQPTQTSVPAEIAYISDHNIWEITWPGGTPKQLTTDGVATNRYFGLTWSPDGSLLAAVKETVSADNGSIVIMKPDGSVVASTPFPAAPDNFPLAWSPDGTMLAFRAYLADVDPSKAAMGLETLFIFDAHTAKTLKTVDFVRNVGTGCGRGYVSSLILAIEAQHYAYEGIDTFTWAPDQNSIIVTRECFNGLAARLDLNTGTLTPGFPEDASYQPGGNLISGILDHTTYVTPTLGLTDVNGKTVRELAEGANPSLTPQYLLGMGRSFWSPDGQVIYYESDDSIWQINLDGTNAHIVIPGTAIDSQNHVTIQVLGGLSPNRQMLYLQIKGTYYADPPDNAQLTEQWYVAQADGSNPQPLPQGISNVVWRPGN